jgi:heme/copper-type cytochrome/quinol oxidase subunit 2
MNVYIHIYFCVCMYREREKETERDFFIDNQLVRIAPWLAPCLSLPFTLSVSTGVPHLQENAPLQDPTVL